MLQPFKPSDQMGVFFRSLGCDIQRPCPGGSYPGVVLDLDISIKVEDEQCDDSLLGRAADSEEPFAVTKRSSTDVIGAELDNDTAEEDAIVNSLDSLAKKRAHSLYVEGKWIHLKTIVRLVFNTLPRLKQSKECLQRVRDHTLPSTAAHLKILVGNSFLVGHCVATLVRCESSAFLAIVQVTHLIRAGQHVYSVAPEEISRPDAQIELRGQVLAFENRPIDGDSKSSWSWEGKIARLRPFKKNAQAKDILVLCFSGVLAIPMTIPEAESSGKSLQTWDINTAELSALAQRLWTQISPGYISKLALCSISKTFPYCSLTGVKPSSCKPLSIELMRIFRRVLLQNQGVHTSSPCVTSTMHAMSQGHSW
jgi:hypothetical protein